MHLAKGKIKLSDFSGSDKVNVLDLFVNNEKILLHMHNTLFTQLKSFKQTKRLVSTDTIDLLNSPTSIQVAQTPNLHALRNDNSLLHLSN